MKRAAVYNYFVAEYHLMFNDQCTTRNTHKRTLLKSKGINHKQ